MPDYEKLFDTEDALTDAVGATCYVRRFDGDDVYYTVPSWRRGEPAIHRAKILSYDRDTHVVSLDFTQDNHG